jgi:hypothetical protein
MTTNKKLSQKAIEEFREAYKSEFGRLLSDTEIKEMAGRLLRFFGILTHESTDGKQTSLPFDEE